MNRATATTGVASRLPLDEKLALTNQLYREYHAICFWHMRPDLIVTEPILPAIVNGLRTHGGKTGALAAAQLLK